MALHVWVSVEPASGQAKAVAAVLGRTAPLVRAEPGCRRYDVFRMDRAQGEPAFRLYEVWADQAALEAHRGYPHYAAYRTDIMPLLSTAPQVELLTALDVAPS